MINVDARFQRVAAASVPTRRYLAHIQGSRAESIQRSAVAVSVFDAWLGPERYHELECDSAEQARRNDSHNKLCFALRRQYEVFAVRCRGRHANRRAVFRRFVSDNEFQEYVDANNRDRNSQQFFVLAVPALGLLYEQHWDDTNIAWLARADSVEHLRDLAAQAGLHVLSFKS